MSYHNEAYKREVYKRWIEQGRPWFSMDKSKDPTAEERKIILEMKKRENDKIKRELELEKRTKQFKVYEKRVRYQTAYLNFIYLILTTTKERERRDHKDVWIRCCQFVH